MRECINCNYARRVSHESHRDGLVGCASEQVEENPDAVMTNKDIFNGWSDLVRPESIEKSRGMARITLVPNDASCRFFAKHE